MLKFWRTYNLAKSFLLGTFASLILFIVGRNFDNSVVLLTFISVFLMFIGLHALNWIFEIDFEGNKHKRMFSKVTKDKGLIFAAVVPILASFALSAAYLSSWASLVIFGNVLVTSLYGMFKHKYPLISVTKAYLIA